MRLSFPPGYRSTPCYLVPIHAALLPFVAGSLRQFEAGAEWQTEADHEAAYNAFAEIEACMTKFCADELIESNRQIYRLLDTALYGRTYTLADNDPLTIYPAIPLVPLDTLGSTPSLLSRAKRMNEVLENALNGDTFTDLGNSTSMRAQLATIIEKLEASGGALDDDMLAQLQLIVGLLA